MLRRTSHVKLLTVNNVVFSSTLQIGDSQFVDSTSHAIAILQEHNHFSPLNEDEFNLHPVFYYQSPCPVIYEDVKMDTINDNPKINVRTLDILAASTSSLIHIGNSDHIRMSNRLKNLLKYDKNPDDED